MIKCARLDMGTEAGGIMNGSRRARFPVTSLAVGMVLSVVGIVSLIWFGYSLHLKSNRMMVTVRESSSLVERVRYYDEVLTMSAGMAAWTGKLSWKERYDQAAGNLDKVFEDIRQVAPPDMTERLMAQTSVANDRLIELEAEAFKLVEAGQGQEAWGVLQSPDYAREKAVYKAGIEEFISAFETYMAATEAIQRRTVLWSAVLGLAVLGLVLVSWLSILKALRRYHRENSLFQDGLEAQVLARTNELSAEIDERKRAQDKLHDAYEVITGSIRYASRIQRAVLPDEGVLRQRLPDHLVIWEPRDTVGGDLYWCGPWGDDLLVVLGDCTGHGVPGAFMTLISIGALERARQDVPVGDLERLVNRMHALMQVTLGQHLHGGMSDDGIELGACLISRDRFRVVFVGARFSLFRVQAAGVSEIKGTRHAMAYRHIPHDARYPAHIIAPLPGEGFFLATDGLTGQPGGPKGIGFGKARLARSLDELRQLPMAEQKAGILRILAEYQGEQRRRDDVSVIGFMV